MTYARTLFFRSLSLLVAPAIGLTAGLSQLSAVAQNAEAPEVESLMLPLELSLGALAILEPGASEGSYRLRFDGTRLSGGEWQLEALDAPHYAIRFVPDAEGGLTLLARIAKTPQRMRAPKLMAQRLTGSGTLHSALMRSVKSGCLPQRDKRSAEEVTEYDLETELILEDDACHLVSLR